jgi:hypothetical protein
MVAKPGKALNRKVDGKAWWANRDPDVIDREFRTLGKEFTTNNLDNAQIVNIGGEPHVLLAHHQTLENLGIEAANSVNFITDKFYKGTTLWKAAVLGLHPRFFVNNAIGNTMMAMLDNAGDGIVYGMYQSYKYMKGEHKANRDLADALDEAGAFKRQGFIERWFGNQLSESFHEAAHVPGKRDRVELDMSGGNAPLEVLQGETLASMPKPNIVTRAAQPVMKFSAKWAERNLRVAVIFTRVRQLPEFKAELAAIERRFGHKKMSAEQKFNLAANRTFQKNPQLAARINQEVQQSMGSYNALSKTERGIRRIDPFYTWQRHIFTNSFHMALDRPGRTAVMAQIGEEGARRAQEMFGGFAPDFMEAFIPLGGEDDGDGRQGFLNTGGFNPYAAFGEEAKMFNSLIPGRDKPQVGETIGSQLNPFLQAGIEGLTDVKLLSGQPEGKTAYGPIDKALQPFGILGAPVKPFANVTLIRALERLMAGKPDYKGTTLYEKSNKENWSSVFGAPYRNVDISEARSLAKSQRTRREGW